MVDGPHGPGPGSGPDLDMEWEVGVFRALHRVWRRLTTRRAPPPPAGAVHLGPHMARLRAVASMVAEEPVRIAPGRFEGGLRGRDVLLPALLSLGPDEATNLEIYVLRAALCGRMRRLERDGGIPAGPPDLWRDLAVVAQAVHALSAELPRFQTAWDAACMLALAQRPPLDSLRDRARAIEAARQAALRGERPQPVDLDTLPERGPASPPVPLWGRLLPVDDRTEAAPLPPDAAPPGEGTEIEAPAIEELRRVKLSPRRAEEVLQHTFEKVDIAENFDGVMRPEDGTDELESHLDGMRELDMRDLTRDSSAQSLYKADLGVEADIPDVSDVGPHERGIRYDEWDQRALAYQRGWCTVYPTSMRTHAHEAARGAWVQGALVRYRKTITQLARRLEDHRTRLTQVDRQVDGDDFDLTAIVDNHAALAAGHSGTDRLYLRAEKRRRDVVTTVLIDVSLSTDAYIAGRRVLDVARDSVLVLGEVAERLGDRFSVLAFASNTRTRCRVWTVKDFDEPWRAARARLGGLTPQGYTRIGPALRHATAELAAVAADRRLLLLITDGKPSDQDRYEGRHGVADVRMALREAARMGVHTHALAVDAVARDYLPTMLGTGAWHILPSPEGLPQALAEVYGRMST